MTDRVFVDTNFLLYARDPSEGHKHVTARKWVEQLWSDGNGRTSVQVLNEFYDAATRRLSRPLTAHEAWDDVTALFAWRPQAWLVPASTRTSSPGSRAMSPRRSRTCGA